MIRFSAVSVLRRVCAVLLPAALLLPRAGAGAVPPGSWTGDPSAIGTIIGTVMDSTTSRPLVGVEARLPALQLSVITNRDGRFTFTGVPDGVHQITANQLGYGTRSQQVTVTSGQTTTVEFRLSEAVISLDQIEVTGYSQAIRASRTGASVELGRQDIADVKVQTADQLLQGRVAGVQVTTVSGQPGSGPEVRIRGLGSIEAGNEPLYIVDGVQLASRSVSSNQNSTSILSGLNPQDIESIEVLKDAAATSIYGAQAANGVVLITTRRGREGATQWSFATEYGFVEDPKVWDVLTGPEFVQLMIESAGNRSVDLGQPRSQGEQSAISTWGNPSEVSTYDWQNAVRQTGAIRSFNGSMSGGSNTTRFYVSGGYDFEESQLVETDFERGTMRANLEHQASERVSILTNIGLSKSTQRGQVGANCINCPLIYATRVVPIYPIFTADGDFNQNIRPFPYSPVSQAYWEIQSNENRQAIGNVTANFAISPRLNFRSLWGVDYRVLRTKRYRPPEQPFIGNTLTESHIGVTNWNTNQVLSFVAPLDTERRHQIQALGGVEYRDESAETLTASGRGLPSGFFTTLNIAQPSGVGGTTGGFKLASAFGRLQYDYANRFILTGALRYDGSSRFGSDFRWGLFYSGSLGWNLSNEAFLEDVSWLDDLTARVSFGITGNSSIGDFESLSLFGSGGSYDQRAALRPSQLGNNLLTWEEARTLNLGLGWSTFSSRFFGRLDLFRTDNKDLLLDAFLPASSGFDDVIQNSGTVRNEGIELELGGVPIRGSNFTWSTSFTIAASRNEIIELVGGLENIGNNIRVGRPLRIHWGSRWAGVNPADGRPMWYDADGDITYVRTAADAQYLGSPLPDAEGGWNNSFIWGPLSLSSFFQYSFGADVQLADAADLLSTASGGNLAKDVLGRWQQPGDITNVPKSYPTNGQPGTSTFTGFSDRWIDDGSYIRLKFLRLDYEVPERLTAFLGATGRVYVSGHNLWLATEFSGIDPEVQALGATTWTTTRQVRFGVEFRR
jgi:TonB-linked SusC/RagA family outer membrane protein